MIINNEENNTVTCKYARTISKLNDIIRIRDYLNIEMIDCSHSLLRWSVSPLISRKKHNVVISSVKESNLIKKMSNISVICSGLDSPELIKRLTTLAMKSPKELTKIKPRIFIKESDLFFYSELSGLSGKIGKYRSNKKNRLISRLGLESDFELTLFFNMIYSIPYSMLRVRLLRGEVGGNTERKKDAELCANFKCKAVNLHVGKNSFLLCTAS